MVVSLVRSQQPAVGAIILVGKKKNLEVGVHKQSRLGPGAGQNKAYLEA